MNKNEFLELKSKFIEISNKNWIEGVAKGTGNVGITFEKMLGKEQENFEIPDFGKIEIKTKLKNSKSDITLFHASPDGELFFETRRLVQLYGYPDSVLHDVPVLNGNIYATRKKWLNKDFQFKLKLDFESKRLVLLIFNKAGVLIDDATWWSFDMLEEKLYRKLYFLAYVQADKKYINGKYHFKYEKIFFYKIKNFSKFLQLINMGVIYICLSIGTFRTGKRKGEMHDHGTCFRINPNKLKLLYEEIEV